MKKFSKKEKNFENSYRLLFFLGTAPKNFFFFLERVKKNFPSFLCLLQLKKGHMQQVYHPEKIFFPV